MMDRQERIKLLKKTKKLVGELKRELEYVPEIQLDDDQEEALHAVLRHLDLRNEYHLGDKLRMAFGYEIDHVTDRIGQAFAAKASRG